MNEDLLADTLEMIHQEMDKLPPLAWSLAEAREVLGTLLRIRAARN